MTIDLLASTGAWALPLLAAELVSPESTVFVGLLAGAALDVAVHGLEVTSVQYGIEPRTCRGWGFAVEWPKNWGRKQPAIVPG